MHERFRRFADEASYAVGSPWASMLALITIIVWALCGPVFGFSDTWQLIINTSTTVITFLMVFLIQSTQNRDARAIQLKLDELLRAVQQARTELVDLEHQSDGALDDLEKEFQSIKGRAGLPSGSR